MSGWAEAQRISLPPPANIDDVRSLNASKVTGSLHSSPIGVTPGQTSQLGHFRAQLKVPYDFQGFYEPHILVGDSPRGLRSLKKQKSPAVSLRNLATYRLHARQTVSQYGWLTACNKTEIRLGALVT